MIHHIKIYIFFAYKLEEELDMFVCGGFIHAHHEPLATSWLRKEG